MTIIVTTSEGTRDRHEGAHEVEMGQLQDLRVVGGEGSLLAAYAPGKWISAVRETELVSEKAARAARMVADAQTERIKREVEREVTRAFEAMTTRGRLS